MRTVRWPSSAPRVSGRPWRPACCACTGRATLCTWSAAASARGPARAGRSPPESLTGAAWRRPTMVPMSEVTAMLRRSITFRVLLLLPLLATGADLLRATLACGSQAQSCLEAAGRGWLGAVAVGLVLVYAVGGALVLARVARGLTAGRERPPGFLRLWALGT